MKSAALFLLLAGWAIVLASLPLLHSPVSRASFVLAGFAVEAMGLGIMFRSHLEGDRG